MLSFVSWQDDSLAEPDDDDVEVSQRLQAQFLTFIDCILYFLSFKFIVYKLLGVSFINLYFQAKRELELSFGEVMKPDSQSLSWTFVFKQRLGSVLLNRCPINKSNFSAKDSIYTKTGK